MPFEPSNDESSTGPYEFHNMKGPYERDAETKLLIKASSIFSLSKTLSQSSNNGQVLLIRLLIIANVRYVRRDFRIKSCN